MNTTPSPAREAVEADSLFELWYSLQSPNYGERKQLARDAYTAGMEDGAEPVRALLAANQEELDRMRAQNEKLQIAATRYGWLRGWGVSVEHDGAIYTGDALDILVDGNMRLDAALSPIQGAGQ